MSTSIAANVGPRTPDPLVASPQPAPHHEEQAKKDAASSSDAIAFTTPVIKVDNNTGLALLVVRDGATGKELDQYPSKKVVEEYQRVQESGPAQAASAPTDSNAAIAGAAAVQPVAAPPVSAATGDARTTTPSVSAVSGTAAVKN